MTRNRIKILLVEDDPGDADLIQEMLSEGNLAFEIERADRLQAALKCISAGTNDVILLDLSLPDSQGLKTFEAMQNDAYGLPIVVLSGLNDEAVALEAVRQGAQDYLVKGQIDGKMLSRVLSYAIERNRMQSAIRSLALVDELTGLYNRRGLMTLAEQHLRLARRAGRALLFYFIDLDGLKRINDQFGHAEGDRAITKASEILKETFRTSDIIGRIGGDEFGIAAIEDRPDSSTHVLSRLQEVIDAYNKHSELAYQLGLSVGFSRAAATGEDLLEDLMAAADKALYEQKHAKQDRRPA